MPTTVKSSFLRYFVGGFAVGAFGLVAVQAHADRPDPAPVARVAPR